MVVGETARSRNFQLYGYPRQTNPMLSKEKGLMVFKGARSQSNTTHKSVPMLLTAANAEGHDCLYHEKGIIAAFREAGFRTAFFSNQQRNHSHIYFLGEEANASVFPTMLSIGGITTRTDLDSLSHANPAYKLGTRYYLNDHNHAVPLSAYGIK